MNLNAFYELDISVQGQRSRVKAALVVSLLFVSVLVSRSSNLVVFQLVRVLGVSNNTKVIAQLLLLEISLRQVLKLTLAELDSIRGCHGDLRPIASDLNSVGGEVSLLSLNLDSLVQVLLERGNVENLVIDRSGTVDDEFLGALLRCLSLRLIRRRTKV